MNKHYFKSTQISPRTQLEKNLKLKLSKSKLSKLNLKKNLNQCVLKRLKGNRSNSNMHNQSLSNVNSTNILNVFTASFDSNKSLQSNQSFKSIGSKENNIELLKNIQIKDSLLDDSFGYKGSDQANKVSFKNLHDENLNDSKKNKIWINISTIYNKANSKTKYHRKLGTSNSKEEGRNARMIVNNSDIELHTTSNNDYHNDRNEVIKLKKKIAELLEINSMIVHSRQELDKENGALNRTIVQLKKYITDNKIEDIKILQCKLKESNEELQKCKEIIMNLKKDKRKIEIQTNNQCNHNNNNSSNSNKYIREQTINNSEINAIKLEHQELNINEKTKLASMSHLNKLQMNSTNTGTSEINTSISNSNSNSKTTPPFDKSKVSELQQQNKLFHNIPKLHYNKRKQQKITTNNHHSYDLDINDI